MPWWHAQAVDKLLLMGGNAKQKCSTGADALMCAAESGGLEVFERVLTVSAQLWVLLER